MGLIKAIAGAAGGVLADQWKEYFYCEALDTDTIVVKGQKRVSGRSSNKHGSENIISSGSVIAVADGQCMIIVEQGKVVELCAEPGEFVYDASTEPTIFAGSLSTGIGQVFQNIGKRFTFGGEPPKDQRVYYFNTKELVGNKYGTPNPIPFKAFDDDIGMKLTISISCFGEYSYRVTNPILFYTNVSGNVEEAYTREQIDSQLKTELLTALQPGALPGHAQEIANALNEVLSAQWKELRGLAIASFGVSSATASEEDENRIKQLQQAAALKDPTMAAAVLASAQAQAMQDAAQNPNAGAFMAFAGMNAAANAGGANPAALYAMGQQAGKAEGWTCAKCGHPGNTGKFCSNCGAPQPADGGWACSCGAVNTGKFCAGCGKAKPEGFKCPKCGYAPKDGAAPKFCPECGEKF